jgi:hypothetical protein
MFFIARQAAATFAGRLGRTSTISTREGSTKPRVYNGSSMSPCGAYWA